MEKINVLKANYLNIFKCLDRYCPNPCYLYREIFIDNIKYNSYKKLEVDGIKFEDLVGILGKNKTNEKYAKVRIRKWLDISLEQYLRTINLELGFDILPDEYKFSPIFISQVDNNLEEVGNLCCPQITSLLLLDKKPIFQIESSITDESKSVIYKIINTENLDFSSNKVNNFFDDIRMYSFNILSSKEYNLHEKLILLNILYESINNINDINGMEERINKSILNMDKLIKNRSYEVFFKRIPENEYLIIEIINFLINFDFSKLKYSEYVEDMELSLNGFLPRMDLYDLPTILIENYKNFKCWQENNNQVLENYILNEYLKEILPYDDENILISYKNLLTDYIVLKIILIGNCVYTGRLDDELLIKKLTSYSRFKMTNPFFITVLTEYFESQGYLNTESLCLIL